MFYKFMLALLSILGTHAMDRAIIKTPYDRDSFETNNFAAINHLPKPIWEKTIGYLSDQKDLVSVSEVNKSLNNMTIPKLRKFFIMDRDVIKTPYDRDSFETNNFQGTNHAPKPIWQKIIGYLSNQNDLLNVSEVNKSLNNMTIHELKGYFINNKNFRAAGIMCTYNPLKSMTEKFEEIYGQGTTHVIFSFPMCLNPYYGIDYVVGFVSSGISLNTFKKIYPQVQGKKHAIFLVEKNDTIDLY